MPESAPESAEACLPRLAALWDQTLAWSANAQQQGQFEQLYQQVLQANAQHNLTRITGPQEFWEKHLWDSLWGIAPWLGRQEGQSSPVPKAPDQGDLAENPAILYPAPDSLRLPLNQPPVQVIDIGSGAGFPGLPVAIAKPDWRLTLVDATQKKLAFVERVQQSLGVRVQTEGDRAERLGHHPRYRQQFDLALIRAVGPATVCAEYALPLVALNGYAVLYRGEWTAPEATALAAALPQLGGRIVAVTQIHTPLTQGIRHCLYLHKYRPTASQFPRRVGLPSRKPL